MDQLSTLTSALAARYTLDREIGEGGMATVYLARDLRHERRVALKVLKPELGAVLGLERFQAEIRVTANLQHPHLLPLFDSGEANGLLYYVMPFVDGETLRARLEREKQLSVEEALRIAVAVASALDYAHTHGVIHRDLKPENILLQAGQPVVADFGIALAVSNAGGNRITQTGLSLGTPQYMSPEQATGDRTVDARSDIYSLGAVTYEMLTGEAPHTGSTAQAIIARLLTERPRSIRSIRPNVSQAVEAAIDHALEKLPADRFSSAREFADALQGRGVFATTVAAAATAAGAAPRGIGARLRDPLVLGAAAVTAVALVGAFALRRAPATTTAAPVVRFEVTLPDSMTFSLGTPWPGAVSPDGSAIAFHALANGKAPQLWVRRSDRIAPQLVPNSAGAFQAVFSPDGKWLAFETATEPRRLVKVRLDDAAMVTIATAGGSNGGDWTTQNEIILGAEGKFHGLTRVSANGGELVEFTHPPASTPATDHLWPVAAPDGETLALVEYTGALHTAQLAMTSTRDGKVVRLGVRGIRPIAFVDDLLVYVQVDGTVMAVPVDLGTRKVRGPAVPVHEPIDVEPSQNGNSAVAAGAGGGLITQSNGQAPTLAWFARGTGVTAIMREARLYGLPRLSPDGRRIAVGVGAGFDMQIWTLDLVTGTFSKLSALRSALWPSWLPDSKTVVYVGTDDGGKTSIYSQGVDAGAPARVIVTPSEIPGSVTVSPDGSRLLFASLRESGWDIFDVAIGDSQPRSARAYLSTSAQEFSPRFSPDGRWVAVNSNESGRYEVYVRSYPDPSVRVQVSTGSVFVKGADVQSAVWSADGKKLYYPGSSGATMVANVSTENGFRVISRDSIPAPKSSAGVAQSMFVYDEARDGQLLTLVQQPGSEKLVYVPNWATELRARIAASKAK